jgi:hypothetical protein
MSRVCLDSIDAKVLFEIGSFVLAEVSQWVIVLIVHTFGTCALMETMAYKTVRNIPAASRDHNALGGLDKKLHGELANNFLCDWGVGKWSVAATGSDSFVV